MTYSYKTSLKIKINLPNINEASLNKELQELLIYHKDINKNLNINYDITDNTVIYRIGLVSCSMASAGNEDRKAMYHAIRNLSICSKNPIKVTVTGHHKYNVFKAIINDYLHTRLANKLIVNLLAGSIYEVLGNKSKNFKLTSDFKFVCPMCGDYHWESVLDPKDSYKVITRHCSACSDFMWKPEDDEKWFHFNPIIEKE